MSVVFGRGLKFDRVKCNVWLKLSYTDNDFTEMDPITADNGIVVNNLNHVRSDSQVSRPFLGVGIDEAKHVCRCIPTYE